LGHDPFGNKKTNRTGCARHRGLGYYQITKLGPVLLIPFRVSTYATGRGLLTAHSCSVSPFLNHASEPSHRHPRDFLNTPSNGRQNPDKAIPTQYTTIHKQQLFTKLPLLLLFCRYLIYCPASKTHQHVIRTYLTASHSSIFNTMHLDHTMPD